MKTAVSVLVVLVLGWNTSQAQKIRDSFSRVPAKSIFRSVAGFYTSRSSLPPLLSEDFSTASGTTPPAGWQNIDNQGNGEIWEFGIANSQYVVDPLPDSPPYAYLNSDGYGTSGQQNTDLISSPINCSSSTNVYVSFDESYRDYDTSDMATFDISTDGLTWVNLITRTSNYNVPFNGSLTVIDITAQAAGQSTVYLRWHYEGIWGYYYAIDNVNVYEPLPDDAGISDALFPSSCQDSLTQPVSATIKNYGITTLDSITAYYQMQGGPVISEPVALSLAPLGEFNYTFTAPANFTGNADTFYFWTSDPNGNIDPDATNDSLSASATVYIPQPASLPFSDNFNNTTLSQNWCPKEGPFGNIGFWFWNNPQAPCDTTAFIGMNPADTINVSTEYLDLYLDLSGGSTHYLAFIYSDSDDDTDPEDGVYISVDNGSTFAQFVSFDLVNNPDAQCNQMIFNLDSLATALGLTLSNQSVIRWGHKGDPTTGMANFFSLENVNVFSIAPADLGVNPIISPSGTVTEGSLQTVSAQIINYGTTPVVSSDVTYQAGAGAPVSESWNGFLDAGDTMIYTFVTQWTPSAGGTVALCAWTTDPNNLPDSQTANDTSCSNINVSGLGIEDNVQSQGYVLFQNQPNPGNQVTEIYYKTPESCTIELNIYNPVGQKVFSVSKTSVLPGLHKETIDLNAFTKGIYFYQLRTDDIVLNRKMTVVK